MENCATLPVLYFYIHASIIKPKGDCPSIWSTGISDILLADLSAYLSVYDVFGSSVNKSDKKISDVDKSAIN